MKKAFRIIALILAGVMCAAVFAGCGNAEPEAADVDENLLGKWVSVGGESTMVFNADGTGTDTDNTGTYISVPFRYRLEGTNHLVITIEVSDEIFYTYSIDGDTLTLHDEYYGDNLVYNREGTAPEPKEGADLLGKWISVDNPDNYFIFNDDGTLIWCGYDSTYKMIGSHSFNMTNALGSADLVYKIDGDTLTLQDPYGTPYSTDVYTYYRADYLESELDENIIGRWVSGGDKELIIFGNGVGDYNGKPVGVYTHDGKFYLADDTDTYYYYYSVKDDVLTITDEDGLRIVFTRPVETVTLEDLVGEWRADNDDFIRITSDGRFSMGNGDEYMVDNYALEYYGTYMRAYMPNTDDNLMFIFSLSGDTLTLFGGDIPEFVYHRQKQ
ncbi:MAG: hypothetical protein IKX98_01895 [Clostridia bacterium]|nr:hypothetical protein [Clostridia bacterium]